MTDEQAWLDLDLRAGQVFTPSAPVDEKSVFAGRLDQIRRVVDAIGQKGLHAIIFGERGVGKTSLANVLSKFLPHSPDPVILSPRINCDSTDTFSTVWQKVFEQIELTHSRAVPGFVTQDTTSTYNASEMIDGDATPDTVRRILTVMSQNALPILIIDEFDRLPQEQRSAFADTIKSLSDHAVAATIVLVGVADTVEQLIEEHHSVSRAVVQIQMPRMAFEEIATILKNGFGRLDLTAEQEAQDRMVRIALGMPHYAHLLGLHAARAAIERRTTTVSDSVVRQAISLAIENSQHLIRSAYMTAIASARKDALFADVLLASALARKDEMGCFAAQDVCEPMRRITGKDYDTPNFVQHLADFSDIKRGKILARTGQPRRYRYRFSDPLMQPFVVMQGIENGRITDKLTSPSDSELLLPLWQSADAPQG